MFVVVEFSSFLYFMLCSSGGNTTKEFLFCSYPLGVVDFHFFKRNKWIFNG